MVDRPGLLGNEGFLGTRDFRTVDGRIILTGCLIIKRDLFGQKEEAQPSRCGHGKPHAHYLGCQKGGFLYKGRGK